MKDTAEKPMFVVCLSNRGHAVSLVTRRLYRRLEDPVAASHAMVRVVDESGEDYLFPAKLFAEISLPTPLASRLALSS